MTIVEVSRKSVEVLSNFFQFENASLILSYKYNQVS